MLPGEEEAGEAVNVGAIKSNVRIGLGLRYNIIGQQFFTGTTIRNDTQQHPASIVESRHYATPTVTLKQVLVEVLKAIVIVTLRTLCSLKSR